MIGSKNWIILAITLLLATHTTLTHAVVCQQGADPNCCMGNIDPVNDTCICWSLQIFGEKCDHICRDDLCHGNGVCDENSNPYIEDEQPHGVCLCDDPTRTYGDNCDDNSVQFPPTTNSTNMTTLTNSTENNVPIPNATFPQGSNSDSNSDSDSDSDSDSGNSGSGDENSVVGAQEQQALPNLGEGGDRLDSTTIASIVGVSFVFCLLTGCCCYRIGNKNFKRYQSNSQQTRKETPDMNVDIDIVTDTDTEQDEIVKAPAPKKSAPPAGAAVMVPSLHRPIPRPMMNLSEALDQGERIAQRVMNSGQIELQVMTERTNWSGASEVSGDHSVRE